MSKRMVFSLSVLPLVLLLTACSTAPIEPVISEPQPVENTGEPASVGPAPEAGSEADTGGVSHQATPDLVPVEAEPPPVAETEPALSPEPPEPAPPEPADQEIQVAETGSSGNVEDPDSVTVARIPEPGPVAPAPAPEPVPPPEPGVVTDSPPQPPVAPPVQSEPALPPAVAQDQGHWRIHQTGTQITG
jgi:hypothetical protein